MSVEYFPGQKSDEAILAIVRPHWLNLLGAMLTVLVAGVLPIILIVLSNAVGGPSLDGTGRAIVTAMLGAYYATLATFFFIRWLAVYLDVGVVTDQRVVDVDQRTLFNRNVAELDCKMVQDVSAEKVGFLRTLFDFGDVIIQTAGERPNFTFEGVPHPEQVVDTIQRSVAGRNDESEAVTTEAAETIHEAAETMKEAAETITEQPAAEPGQADPKTTDQPTPEAVEKTASARSAPPTPPPPKEPTAPADSPPSEPSQPPKPTSQPPDELQDLPRDYEK